MKRLLALLLTLSLLIFNIFFLAACAAPEADSGDSGNGSSDGDGDNEGGEGDGSGDVGDGDSSEPKYDSNGVIIPVYKDHERQTKDFEELALNYFRPDVDALRADFDEVSALIEKNEVSFDDQLAAIESLEDGYFNFYTMTSLAEILSYRDTKNEYWAGESEYLTSVSAAFTQTVERMYVACARSPHKESFESEYFNTGIDEYVDGGDYTDRAVELYADEALLMSEYKNPDISSAVITYNGVTDTYEKILASLNPSNLYYDQIVAFLDQQAYYTAISDIYVDLVKVRALLAEEFGFASYVEMAYDEMGYEYSPDDFLDFVGDVKSYVYPVYDNLYRLLFEPYFNSTLAQSRDWPSALNTLYSVVGSVDSEFGDIFGYMLQHGLYDISGSSDNRFGVSFTTYLYTNNSPFMYITAEGTVSDYSTIAHEFGHYIDFYVNDGSNNSLELAEVCSQGFDLLSLINLEDHSTSSIQKYLKYSAMQNVLETLLYQSFYAAFEHMAYSLEYEDITLDKLNEIVTDAALMVFESFNSSHGIWSVLISHMFIAPMYVQSYATSVVPALELYLMEIGESGKGLNAYKSIIYRSDNNQGFLDTLALAGLSSPFKSNLLDSLTNELYFHLTGFHFKKESGANNAA